MAKWVYIGLMFAFTENNLLLFKNDRKKFLLPIQKKPDSTMVLASKYKTNYFNFG